MSEVLSETPTRLEITVGEDWKETGRSGGRLSLASDLLTFSLYILIFRPDFKQHAASGFEHVVRLFFA